MLLSKYFNKEVLAPGDAAYLEDWINQSKENQQLFDEVCLVPELMTPVQTNEEDAEVDVKKAWGKLKEMGWKQPRPKPVKVEKVNWTWYLVAAVVMGIICMCSISWGISGNQQVPSAIKDWQHGSKLSTRHAYLMLENGEPIVLDSYKKGVIATQGNTQVTRDKDGGLLYTAATNNSCGGSYNKVIVPWGSKVVYIQLSDGSKVWVNAGSSIRYPVNFTGGEREVEVTGEAYFEIFPSARALAQNSQFVVCRGHLRVVVRGARFNVNMNDGRGVKVTMRQGSVKVSYINSEQIVKAGQQAVLDYKTIALVDNVDVESELAWKK